jgi:hypothetical protein
LGNEAIHLLRYEPCLGGNPRSGSGRTCHPDKRGKDKLVILTAEQYRKLIGRSHTMAYGLMDAPEDIHQELMIGLQDNIEADNA